jgi:hypothetical protein
LPGYLPLCASRQGLLFETCRTCAWWQTPAGPGLSVAALGKRLPAEQAADSRRRWMTSVEDTWGMAGLLLEGRGSIHFAPAASVPRLHDLQFGPFPESSALVFCLACAEDQPRYQAGRVLHNALGRLKERDLDEVYAVAAIGAAYQPLDGDHCRFFAPEFLGANGFEPEAENAGLILMRVDLGGLLSVLGRAKAVLKELLRNEPAPSAAAWTRGML